MSNNFIPFWENYSDDHDDFMSDYFNETSMNLDMKFNFNNTNKSTKIEAKTSMENDKISSELSFNGDFFNGRGKCEGTIQDNGDISVENTYDYGQNAKCHFLGYMHDTLKWNADNQTHVKKLYLRTKLPFANVALGFGNLNFFNFSNLGVLSLSAIFRNQN